MAPRAAPRSLLRLTTIFAPVIALFGLWLWWFRSRGTYLPSIPFVGHSKLAVTIRQGTFVGVEAESDYPQTLELFLGIPYALSTAGVRRFRPPVGVDASKKTFDASKHGNRCPAGGPDDTLQSEDCLNLNIYRPKQRGSTKPLPVLVHIHGGSFNFGFGHGRQISNLVGWAAEPFIGISFNYRLGAFGFLASNLTESEGLLNVGLKDQALLLEWVQDNIAAFGGNPKDVTIMGSSAGAHSVSPQALLYTLMAMIKRSIGTLSK